MTRYDNKTKFGKAHSNFMFAEEACQQCTARNKIWIWIGCSFKGNSEDIEWRRAETNPLNDSEPLCLSKDMVLVSGIEMPKHISKLPSWVLQLYGLEMLSLAGCGLIEAIPHEDLIKFPFLKSLDLSGCGKLYSPPQEICSQGGKATMEFLREVKRNGKFNETMNLFLLGDGEAGKSSVIMALKSDFNRAAYIRADHRTVGIDITTWRSGSIVFRTYDFAGQPVYAKTHQHFLVRRALYMFVWRARSGLSSFSSVERSVKFWLESLQNRMPGSYVMLVVTHIDQVSSDVLNRQVQFVKETVRKWQADWNGSSPARNGGESNLPVLKVWNQGESIPVDCLSGDGVSLLREAVQRFSSAMPWYKEALPPQWIALQESLVRQRILHKYITWSAYSSLAAKIGVTERNLHMVTTYLHESGFIQYFGDFGLSKPGLAGDKSSGFLKDFVFISCPWMIDVMKGLLSHDRQALMDFLLLKKDKEMLIHLNALNKYGILNRGLLPYLWPSQFQCPEFWGFLCSNDKRERLIWRDNPISNQDDLDCALAVLDGFDQLADQGSMFLVPGALAPAQFPSTPALDVNECPYRLLFHYSALPPGALDSIFVRIAKNGCRCAQITSFMAVFYDSAGDICQIFCFVEQGVPDIEKLVLRSSSQQFLTQAEQEVLRMENRFCGLQRQHRSEREHSSLAVTKKFFWQVGEQTFSPSQEIVCCGCISSHQRNAHIFNKKEFFKYWLQIFCEGAATQQIACPVCHHMHLILDILTTCRVSDSERRQCPCCQHFGNDTDLFFSSGECRLQLNLISKSEQDKNTVTCFECMRQGRIGQIRVSDLVQEEVFVSGLSVLNKNLQCSVGKYLQQIQMEADVGCSERLESLKGSLVVVLLLSDAYLHSQQCREEFISAFRSHQALIPILLPDLGTRDEQGVSVGWTGSNDKEYWVHAVEKGNCEGLGFVDWSLLRHFSSVQYPLALDSDQPLKQDCIEFARLVTDRINQNIQRDGKANTYSDMQILGVRLSYFDKFIEKFGGEGNFLCLTTEQVMHRFVKPATEQSRLSLCELLMSQGLESEVGKSEWFYSHAWKHFFLDTVSALKSHFEGSEADPVIWFDVFSVSHHKTDQRPVEWWNSVFLSAIGNIGNLLLLLQPYEDPKSQTPAWITLTRLWCVYEIYAGAVTSSRFEITMTKEMSTRFLSDLYADPASVLSTLESFDCANCVASNKEDEEQVFEVITKSAGFPILNSTVMCVIERWLYEVLLTPSPQKYEQLQQAGQPALNIMEVICKRCLQLREQRLSADHPDTANSRRILEVIERAQSDCVFLQNLVKKGWKAHELEVFQQEQDARTAAEEHFLQQRSDEIAQLVAEEEKGANAAEETRISQLVEAKAATDGAKADADRAKADPDPNASAAPAEIERLPEQLQRQPACCSVS